MEALTTLDRHIDEDPSFGIFYYNRRHRFRTWARVVAGAFNLKEPKIAPIYARRMLEQKLILEGTFKRGHRAFGFMPLEGYC